MDKDLVHGQIGDVAKYDLSWKGSLVHAEIAATFGKSAGGMFMDLDPIDLLDFLKKTIPGPTDDLVINAIEAIIRALTDMKTTTVTPV